MQLYRYCNIFQKLSAKNKWQTGRFFLDNMCCQGDRTGSHNCIKFTSKQSRIIKLLEKTRLPYKGKEDKMTKQVLKNDILSIRN